MLKAPAIPPKNFVYTIEYTIDALDPSGLEETLDSLKRYGSGSSRILDVKLIDAEPEA